MRKGIKLSLFVFVWIALIGVSFGKLFKYANTPGAPAQAFSQWPKSSALTPDADSATLVVFAHPHCPCTAATVNELERLLPYTKNKLKIFVVFFSPEKKSEGWVKNSSLWKQTQAMPGVQPSLDPAGQEANHFGASTSGQSFLYDKSGGLLFAGGITPERGHMGDSAGRSAILQFMETGKTGIANTPVFGCSLKKPERSISSEEPTND